MIYGITATREGLTKEQYAVAATYLRHATEVHHGDCVGGDAMIHSIAQAEAGARQAPSRPDSAPLRIVVHPPESDALRAHCTGYDDARAPLPYHSRNKAIVRECAHLLAFPKGEEEIRSGTWMTVRLARAVSRPYTIIMPDGTVISDLEDRKR